MNTQIIYGIGIGILFLILLFVLSQKTKNNKEKFLMQIDPATKCCGGRYMWGSKDSDTFKYCSNPKNAERIKNTCCGSGFHGRPVHYPDSSQRRGISYGSAGI